MSSLANISAAENCFARDHLRPWQADAVRRLQCERGRLLAARAEAMDVVRHADRRRRFQKTHWFDLATRLAFQAAAEISRLDEAIGDLESATFRDLLPVFREHMRNTRSEAA